MRSGLVARISGPARSRLRGDVVARIVGYLRPHRRLVAAATACMLVQAALGLAPVFVVKAAIDHLQDSGSFGGLVWLVGAGVAIAVLAGLVNVLRTWLVLRITTGVVARLRHELVGHLLGQSIGYYTSNRGGELMSRVLNDVNVAERSLGDTSLSFARNVITAIAALVLMAVFEWRLALVTLTVIPLVVFVLAAGGRPIYRSRKEVQERLAALTAHAQEALSLSGIMLVKSFGREATEHARNRQLTDELRATQIRAGMTARWFGLVLELVQFTAPLVLLLAGAWLVLHDYATLSTVVAFVTVLALRFGMAIAALGTGAVTLIGALPAWERIFEVLDADVEARDRPGAIALDRPQGAVSLENVTFRYPRQREPAIDAVSLAVEPGQLVALVGPSGAGKTTLTSLLARFYEPDQGAVRIDGHDLRDLQLASIAASIGLVLQDTYLFHGTLRENLLYARPDAGDELLARACEDAQLAGVVAALSDGLDTVVGERGHRLSGGEKQRVAVARVMVKDPPILILDEATSHLDTVSERLVQGALARLFAGRTSFVIAHRLSTILAADVIVVLDRGRIVEQGRHVELLEAGGLYATLCELQFPGGGNVAPADLAL